MAKEILLLIGVDGSFHRLISGMWNWAAADKITREMTMTSIAIYLLFVSALAGYRSSKYWPKELKGLAWLGHVVWGGGSALLGTALLIYDRGWTIGLLLALVSYMALLSCTVCFLNCKRPIWLTGAIVFHTLCFIGFILTCRYAC